MLLSEKYRNLADSYNNEGFVKQKELIEESINNAAKNGKTQLVFYPKETNFKGNIMSWLKDEGFTAVWNQCQFSGTYITIIW
ncbi:hypothetical protein SEA1_gp0174 [Salmonella phage SEA1]|nr:hypothetical protein SEA1_gp0174 [Salmonella phage SEA1]